jgi:hypothetical protein
MNWTGGSLKRVPKNNSLTSRERLIQRQFIERKEMQRKCALNQNKSNQQIIDSNNNQSSDERHHSSEECKSNSSKESTNSQKMDTKVKPKVDTKVEPKIDTKVELKVNTKINTKVVTNEYSKRYFDEILDQLVWRHSDFKKDKSDHNSTHNQIN